MTATKHSSPQETLESMREYLRDFCYSDGTLENLRFMWEQLAAHANATGYSEFTEDWVIPFIDAYIESMGDSPRYESVQRYYRAGQMLCDFQKNGTIRRFTGHHRLVKTPETYKPLYDAVDTYATKYQLHSETKMAYTNEVNKLVIFLEKNGVGFSELSFETMCAFLKTLTYMKQSSIANAHMMLRNVLSILYREGKTNQDLSLICERISVPRNRTIPSVLTTDEIEKVLSTVDRSNATGKRNYAVLLLAARLGMRVSDIRTLRFDNINWNTCELCFIQEKTKNEIVLPLLEEVGLAIIDYVKSGRPASKSSNVFVSHHTPFNDFSTTYNFSELLGKHLHKAGIKISHGQKRGLHTLRHSLASNLLAEGTVLPVVSEVLGHSQTESTMTYLKVSIPQLRQCSLEAEFGGES